jgi:subtilisin family serine protease
MTFKIKTRHLISSTIISSFMLLAYSTEHATANENPVRFDNKQLFVKVKKGFELPNSQLIDSAKKLFGSIYLVKTQNASALSKELMQNPTIEYTEKNTFHGVSKLPEIEPFTPNIKMISSSSFNDPLVSKVWSFADDSGFGISVHKAYEAPLNRNKDEVIVAVVDTGVDYNHEDLRDIMWINSNEIAGNRIDDDNNGYIDDVYGINTLVRDSQGRASGNPMASHAHGTHVAGTIAAAQNNNIGIAGVASRVKIMAIRTVPDNADETDVDIIESFLYAAKNGARLINCSFGKSHNEGGQVVNETIDHIAQTYGTLVVAAAGNDSTMFAKWDIDKSPKYPASFNSNGLMVIASTASNGGLSSFSNVGKKSVDLAAPGSNIFSTVPGNKYAMMSGTSMATPTAVGMLAEVLSHFPGLTPYELKQLAIESVTPVTSFTDYMVSEGRGNLYNTLQKAQANYADRL